MPQRTTVRATKVPEIRRGDTVVVLVGRDAGKRGVVERVVRLQEGVAIQGHFGDHAVGGIQIYND